MYEARCPQCGQKAYSSHADLLHHCTRCGSAQTPKAGVAPSSRGESKPRFLVIAANEWRPGRDQSQV